MTKRIFRYLRKPVVFLVVLGLLLSISSGIALAVTYDLSAYLALGVEPIYWGGTWLQASEPVDWLRVQSTGFEIGVWWWEKDWEVSHYVENTPYCGITGDGTYYTSGMPCGSYLHEVSLGWWPGSGFGRKTKSIDHPYECTY